MEIIETPIFTKKIRSLLTVEEYQHLQSTLVIKPDIGQLIPGGKGIRKLRWGSIGKGKRTAIRVIYYWYVAEQQLLMLLPYRKSNKEDLSPQELKTLMYYVEEFLL